MIAAVVALRQALGVCPEVCPAVLVRCHHRPKVARAGPERIWLLTASAKGLLLDDSEPFIVFISGTSGVVPVRDCLTAVDDAVGIPWTREDLRRCVPSNT